MSSTTRQQILANFELLGRRMSTATILLHTAIGEALELSPIELKSIDILGRLGPLTAGELAKQTNLTTGAVTNLLDRLASRHLVERQRDQADRRKVIVQLKRGKKMTHLSETYDSLGEAWQELCQDYSTAELKRISDFMERTIAMLQEEVGKVGRA